VQPYLYFQHLFELYCHQHQFGEVACCAGVLHTIMFNRSLGQVKPQDVDSELFDITYVSEQAVLPAYLVARTTSLCSCSTQQSMGQARVGSVVSSNAFRDKEAHFARNGNSRSNKSRTHRSHTIHILTLL
jgi:hypothetical protein